MKEKHIASVSFGKDSLATILLAKEHDEPLDEAVYCEVMFDKDISGEVPEHRDFIYDTAIPKLEEMGVRIIVLRSAKTYVDLFTGRVTRGPKKGMVRSFPICGRCAVQRDCKVRPIQRYQKTLPPETVKYIGIARDETERLLRLEDGRQVSLLAKYNFTEQDAWQLCEDANVIKLRKRTLNVILSALSSGTISLFVIVRLNNFYFVYQTIKLTSEIKRDILLSKGVGAMKISVGMS